MAKLVLSGSTRTHIRGNEAPTINVCVRSQPALGLRPWEPKPDASWKARLRCRRMNAPRSQKDSLP
jgi:hypothetical protein